MDHQLTINSLEALPNSARELLNLCRNRYFFAFYGDLGAGKTTLIKTMCQQLGSADEVSSPTYSLVNEYLIESGERKRIYHMDLYRVQSPEELDDMGIMEYLDDEEAYVLVEWPQLLEPLFPQRAIRLTLSAAADGKRLLTISED